MNGVETDTPDVDELDDRAIVAEFAAARRARRYGMIGVALAIFCCWFGLPAIRNAEAPRSTAQTSAQSATVRPVAYRPSPPAKRIEDIQLGDRVAGRNPLREEVLEIEPERATWREIRLLLVKEDGGRLWTNLLRPVEWLELYEAQVGGTIYLDLPEMGAVGDAEVLEILPCPQIDAGDGAIVTGQFKHEVADGEIIELRLDVQPAPTRVTANHPYWSLDREDFIPAGVLRAGEHLDTLDGDAFIASVTRVPYSGLLYNLETTEHVYRVGPSGVLVHNAYDAHHPIPKFLGGALKQDYSYIKPSIHHEFNSLLRQELKAVGFTLPIGSKKGSTLIWKQMMLETKGAQQRAFDAVRRASSQIDAKYGTTIRQLFEQNFKNGNYLGY